MMVRMMEMAMRRRSEVYISKKEKQTSTFSLGLHSFSLGLHSFSLGLHSFSSQELIVSCRVTATQLQPPLYYEKENYHWFILK